MQQTLLYITNGINGSGGLERVLSIKASALATQYDYKVYILGLNNGNDAPFYTFSDDIHFISLPYSSHPIKGFLDYKTGLERIVQEIKPAIVLVCDDGFKGFCVPKIIKNIPIVYERHASIALNTSDTFKGRWQKKLMQSMAKDFDKFVVLTQNNTLEWKGDNVMVIPNPLSFQSTQSAPLTAKKVIAVGAHASHKGYDRLLAMWQHIEKIHPDWQLEIYGKIDAQETYIKLAQSLGLQQIAFFQPQKDIQSIYESASILVLPSYSEGFGMVLIEAMACGVPCISFDCPSGPKDIITHEEDGYLVPNNDTTQFESYLNSLMNNEDKRKELGANAFKNVQRYSVAAIVAKWDALFKTLLS